MYDMQHCGSDAQIPAVKDDSKQGPIPQVWRPVFRAIVMAFMKGDFKLSAGVPGVSPVSDAVAGQIEACVNEYGETLTELPEETWTSSVCIWNGDRWDALIDLWTSAGGRSDLVMQAFVTESACGFDYEIHMVYVP